MRKVLIVEDHEVVGDALAGIVGGIPGLEVVGIATGVRDGMAKLQSLAPDILLADLMLDDGSATEILRLIRSDHLRTRVIVLTGLRDVFSANEALAAGAMGYVLKAQPSRELIEAIESVVAGRRYIAPKIAAQIDAAAKSDGSRQGLECLTRREAEILRMLAHGYSNREVASRLNVSTKTIETHRSNMNRKLSLRNTVDLIRFAAAHGIGSAPLRGGAAPAPRDVAGEPS
jgi:two-component system NarL family response regulator